MFIVVQRSNRILQNEIHNIFRIANLSGSKCFRPKRHRPKFSEHDRSVTIRFETEQEYLQLEKPTLLNVSFENIDLRNTAIVGHGIQIIKRAKDLNICEVTAHMNSVVNDNLEISIMIRKDEEQKYVLFHKFLVPVRK